jgi:hypothetical protein
MASGELRLLVKTSSAVANRRLAVKDTGTFTLTPLMPSIDRPSRRGLAAAPAWHIATAPNAAANPWDVCHQLVADGLGVAGGSVILAEPDLEQNWLWTLPNRQAFGITSDCTPMGPDSDIYAVGDVPRWFADNDHSQLDLARRSVDVPANNRVRIAHLDTGYDPGHSTTPKFLNKVLARNFVDAKRPLDASDQATALINPMFGHGTATLGILAGNVVKGLPNDSMNGRPLGGAADLEVIPIRVANWTVQFRSSVVAQAFDYVHSLCAKEATRVHVLTMSMGGIASAAWADAVNALYERGVFVVAAAGNNFANLPTRFIVYPARFNRVVAACGVMADGRPYVDLPTRKMAGCYGPEQKNPTTLAAYTPNVPWAKFGCRNSEDDKNRDMIDLDGGGTSAAAPQIAAAAALWLQKNKARIERYPEDWMRVEAVRNALFKSAKEADDRQAGRVGRHGSLRAQDALGIAPQSNLTKTNPDSASFSLLRVLTGLGVAAQPTQSQRMLELEALQISQQSRDIEEMLDGFDMSNPQASSSPQGRRIVDALLSHPTASGALKQALGGTAGGAATRGKITRNGRTKPPTAQVTPIPHPPASHGLAPPVPAPPARPLWVYARDPLMSSDIRFYDLNEVALDVRWEPGLKPGPVGEYLEVIDVDPPSGLAYAPVDLNDPRLLAQGGIKPTQGNPQFHQQMVYAVAMTTIKHFEKALGRVALWAPREARINGERTSRFVRRLRIYPHALREANAYYSPDKRALLFGYFRSAMEGGDNLPGGLVFNCLSHDIIAHETTHALLDGLHPHYKEPTSLDMVAFHEAFADIVALFQHFTMPAVLGDAIRRAKGHAGLSEQLAGLAFQFGQATGSRGALRSGIDRNTDDQGAAPRSDQATTEPHARGEVLVAAVFAAFRQVYDRKTKDLFRVATGGTGVLPTGEIPHDLANRLAAEAADVAGEILAVCIRALDYCPPVDLTFGEYLRALITADRDLIPDDRSGYRVAFISAFRQRGIYPAGALNLSVDTLTWQPPDIEEGALHGIVDIRLVHWHHASDRRTAFQESNMAARDVCRRILGKATPESVYAALGLIKATRRDTPVSIDGESGTVSRIEVYSVRPAQRVGESGDIHSDIIIKMTQTWQPEKFPGERFRGGCTLVCDLKTGKVRYAIRKRVGHSGRTKDEAQFRGALAGEPGSAAFFMDGHGHEPFAMLHRKI